MRSTWHERPTVGITFRDGATDLPQDRTPDRGSFSPFGEFQRGLETGWFVRGKGVMPARPENQRNRAATKAPTRRSATTTTSGRPLFSRALGLG